MADVPMGKLPLSLSEADVWEHLQVDHSIEQSISVSSVCACGTEGMLEAHIFKCSGFK